LTDTFMAPVADPPIPPLKDEIRRACADPGQFPTADNAKGDRTLVQWQADAVMDLLVQRGHYLPGAPCAQVILDDAKSFAERLTITTLALRLLNMLAFANVQTPETKGARRWLDDYLEGKNHGPAGKPMLWPLRLPGICSLLREWGFEPTPTMPPWVARSLPNPGMN
jgi:hypothetical protein